MSMGSEVERKKGKLLMSAYLSRDIIQIKTSGINSIELDRGFKQTRRQRWKQPADAEAMSWAVSRNSCCRQLLRESARAHSQSSVHALPSFLVPAFSLPQQRPQSALPFSTSTACQSRIGAAPISVPPEVTLTFVDLPKTSKGTPRANAADVPTMAVDVSGPLGS